MFEPLCAIHRAAELHTVQRVQDADQQRAFNLMHDGKFREALDIFERKGAIRWSQTTEQTAEALQRQYAGDIAADPDRKRFIFAYTNDQVDVLNRFAREVHRQRGALLKDHAIEVARGTEMFAVGDRVQFTDNGWSRKEKEAGLVNGGVGTVVAIDTSSLKPRMTVELDTTKGEPARRLSFLVGPDREGGEFNAVRLGYSGTIYKGQGRTLDQTYVFHSHYWREASSYVALTRHRESVAIFVARDTAADLNRLARQMGRDEIKRAAISFVIAEEPARGQAVGDDAGAKQPRTQTQDQREPEVGRDTTEEQAAERLSAAAASRQRGQRVSRGWAERGGEPQAGDTERGQLPERRRAQRGEPEPTQEEPTRNRGPDLER
jgi:hypothetical protein